MDGFVYIFVPLSASAVTAHPLNNTPFQEGEVVFLCEFNRLYNEILVVSRTDLTISCRGTFFPRYCITLLRHINSYCPITICSLSVPVLSILRQRLHPTHPWLPSRWCCPTWMRSTPRLRRSSPPHFGHTGFFEYTKFPRLGWFAIQGSSFLYTCSSTSTSCLLYSCISSQARGFPSRHSDQSSNPGNL